MDSLLDKLCIFAIQLKNIERENFDGSLAKHHICQYFPPQNFLLYSMQKLTKYIDTIIMTLYLSEHH